METTSPGGWLLRDMPPFTAGRHGHCRRRAFPYFALPGLGLMLGGYFNGCRSRSGWDRYAAQRVGLWSQCRFVDRLRVKHQECLRSRECSVTEIWWPVVSAPGVWLLEQMPPNAEGWHSWTMPTPDATSEWTSHYRAFGGGDHERRCGGRCPQVVAHPGRR